MKRAQTLALGIALSASLAAGCSGKNSLPSPGGSFMSTPAPYSGPAQLAAFAWQKKLLQGANSVGPADARQTIGMQVLVNQRDAPGLIQYAKDVADRKSPVYRHFLTPAEIAGRFGASQADYERSAAYFQQYGIHVSGWPQRQAISLTGAVGQFEKAFNTTFDTYKSASSTFIAPEQAPHLTSAAPISAVLGLVHVQLAHTFLLHPPNSQFRGYSPQQLQRAFDLTGAYSGGFAGTGINVGIIGTGPISSADVPALGNLFHAPVAAVQQVDVTDSGVTSGLSLNSPTPSPQPSDVSYPYSSGFQTPPPVTAVDAPACTGGQGLPGCNPEDMEAQLDTEAIASFAPSSNVLFYLGYNPNDCYLATGVPAHNSPCGVGNGVPAEGIDLTDAEIQQAIADDNADVLSLSFGLGELYGVAGFVGTSSYYDAAGYGFGPVEMAALASEGIAVFVSSGDNGAYECGAYLAYYYGNAPCVSYPASDPNVVSVGGVTAPLNDDGSLQTQFTAWGEQTTGGGSGLFQNDLGSGGGVSAVFMAPTWQVQSGVTSLTGGFRGQPDISMMADPSTGPTIVANAAFPGELGVFPIGGTSAAAPEMAAVWALVLQACKSDAVCSSKGSGPHPYRLGNPAPLLYAIYRNPTQYPYAFVDVQYGANGGNNAFGPPGAGFSAGKGYDLVTGIGVPLAGHFIDTILTNQGSNASWTLP